MTPGVIAAAPLDLHAANGQHREESPDLAPGHPDLSRHRPYRYVHLPAGDERRAGVLRYGDLRPGGTDRRVDGVAGPQRTGDVQRRSGDHAGRHGGQDGREPDPGILHDVAHLQHGGPQSLTHQAAPSVLTEGQYREAHHIGAASRHRRASRQTGEAEGLQAPPLVLFSLATVGYAANALGSTSLIPNQAGAGGPLAVLFIAIIAAECGKAVSKETRVD